MSAEDKKDKVRRFFEQVVNEGEIDELDEILASNFVLHDPYLETPSEGGLGNVKNVVTKIRTAFPDVHVTVENPIEAENESVVASWIGTGTNAGEIESSNRKGETQLIEATSVQVELHGMTIFHFSNGKIDVARNVMVDTRERDELLSNLPTERRCSWFCHVFGRCCK